MLPPEPANSPLALTMFSLHVDAVVGQVVLALREQGVRALLLKGASVVRWLHDDGGVRPYRDVDLLVAPTSLARAGDVLRRLGYAPRFSDDAPGVDSGHAHEWDQAGWPTVDLHYTLEGVRVSPARCWAVLSARTRPLTVGGTEVEVLEIPALACNLALHAADSGGDGGDGPAGRKRQKALDDLSRAVDRLGSAGWTEALAIAEELEATAAFGVGMRLDQRGGELADELGIPTNLTVELVLRASSESVLALPFDRLAAAVGARAKGQIVIEELVPSGPFLRRWWPPAGRGRRWLVVGYLYRFVWVTAHAPRGLWLWVRARRVVAAHRDR